MWTFLFIFRIGEKVWVGMLNSSCSGRYFPVNSPGVSWGSVLTLKEGRVASICSWENFRVWEMGEFCVHVCFNPGGFFLDTPVVVSSLFSSSSRLGAAAAGNLAICELFSACSPSLLLHWCLLIISVWWKSSLYLCLETEQTPHFDLKKWQWS